MATIIVDGKKLEVRENATLIDELLDNGINIPHFCYHKSLGKDGNCRMCMVEIEGKKRPQIACDTPVKDGMVIKTKGENIDRVKRQILELELINHPVDCPVCDQAGECSLQNYYMDVGLYDSRLDTPKNKKQKHVDLGSNVILDQERCVLCTRCVRFTHKITKTKELGVVNRNDHSYISTFPGKKLSNPYAMNVVDLCPVGALTNKDFRFKKRVWFLKSDEAICDGCSRGCSIYVDHEKAKQSDDIIYRYRPRYNQDVNGYFICDYGRLSYKKENEGRLNKAYIRGLESELDYALSKLDRLIKRYSSKGALILSPALSLEEMYRLKILAKRFDFEINGYDENYDETFEDDFLKKNDKTPNRASFSYLKIDETKDALMKIIREKEAILLIGRNDAMFLRELGYEGSILLMSSYMFEITKDMDLVLPMASHTERAGSFINCDGYLQYSSCKIEKDNPSPRLLDVLSMILGDGLFTCKEIWNKGGLKNEEFLEGINYEELLNKSVKLD